uniref:Uncharacterized protein n=1 Tax=Lepeophtheirus salmonis TaxID=72036 RepID=A0A0K2T9W9_LEPSM
MHTLQLQAIQLFLHIQQLQRILQTLWQVGLILQKQKMELHCNPLDQLFTLQHPIIHQVILHLQQELPFILQHPLACQFIHLHQLKVVVFILQQPWVHQFIHLHQLLVVVVILHTYQISLPQAIQNIQRSLLLIPILNQKKINTFFAI